MADGRHFEFAKFWYHTVITATSISYGKMESLTPCKSETLEQIDTQVIRIDYVQDWNLVKIRLRRTSRYRGEI